MVVEYELFEQEHSAAEGGLEQDVASDSKKAKRVKGLYGKTSQKIRLFFGDTGYLRAE